MSLQHNIYLQGLIYDIRPNDIDAGSAITDGQLTGVSAYIEATIYIRPTSGDGRYKITVYGSQMRAVLRRIKRSLDMFRAELGDGALDRLDSLTVRYLERDMTYRPVALDDIDAGRLRQLVTGKYEDGSYLSSRMHCIDLVVRSNMMYVLRRMRKAA